MANRNNKKESLDRIDRKIKELERLIDGNDFDFGAIKSTRSSSSHETVLALGTRLRRVAEQINDKESEYVRDELLNKLAPLINAADGNPDKIDSLISSVVAKEENDNQTGESLANK